MDERSVSAIIDRLADVHRAGLEGTARSEGVAALLLPVRTNCQKSLASIRALPGEGEDAARRAARVDVLGEVCNGEPANVDDVLPFLLSIAVDEADPVVLASLCDAFAKTSDERAATLVLPLAGHPSGDVRLAVAQALPSLWGESGDESSDAVDALVRLSNDPVAAVRDWATFGLGLVDQPGPDVLDAMFARLGDDDLDVRAEALWGLAEHRDARVHQPLLEALGDDSVGVLAIRAAAWLADPTFHTALTRLASTRDPDDDDDYWAAVDLAARRCDPTATRQAAEVETHLLEQMRLEAERHPKVWVELMGTYPDTEIVFIIGGETDSVPLWNYQEDEPFEPTTFELEWGLRLLRSRAQMTTLR